MSVSTGNSGEPSPRAKSARRVPKWVHALFATHCALTLFAVTWPGYAWLGNRIEPLVLGLPFSLAWLIGWVLATLIALVLYERATSAGE